MRKLSSASVAMILAISLYFMLSWGFDAFRMLTSPTYGLDDVWRSQFVFAIGSYLHLAPVGLLKLAAFFAILKLAVAAICAVHIADRFRSLAGGKADGEILEAGLMLVVAISILSVGPAVWSQNAELVRAGAIQLSLAALAVALLMLERSYVRKDERAEARIEAARTAFDETMARTSPRVHA
ncbi:MAG: hypothetical protein WCA36_19415 [Pseudolabrys sp.]|jgi:hypothetical protein